MREAVVFSSGVRLAIREFDGPGSPGDEGTPVLLLHGAGGNLATVTVLAEALRKHHRVITMDLRGHGRSEDGPWDWETAMTDMATVIDERSLGTPAVVGVSLGGMIAAHWARHHPECPGVISLDGNAAPSRPDQLPGMRPEDAEQELARLHETFSAMTAAMAEPLSTDQVNAALEQQRGLAAHYGIAEDVWLEGFRRNVSTSGDATVLRPRPNTVDALRELQRSVDLPAIYRDARCPLLLVQATEDMPEQRSFQALYTAYRKGLTEHLESAARVNPLLKVSYLDNASHAMVAEQPGRLAELITDFLTPAATPG